MFILSLFVIRRNLGTVLVYCFYVSFPLMILTWVSYNQGGCKMVTFCILSACICWHSVRAGFPLSPTCSFVYLCYGLRRFLKILWYYFEAHVLDLASWELTSFHLRMSLHFELVAFIWPKMFQDYLTVRP